MYSLTRTGIQRAVARSDFVLRDVVYEYEREDEDEEEGKQSDACEDEDSVVVSIENVCMRHREYNEE